MFSFAAFKTLLVPFDDGASKELGHSALQPVILLVCDLKVTLPIKYALFDL
jgi:hypothetical protein